MLRTQIQLTEEQFKALKIMARRKNLSVAELIRQGVDVLLRSYGEVSMEERKRRAIEAAGRFQSGKKDISIRHDEYIAEAFRS